MDNDSLVELLLAQSRNALGRGYPLAWFMSGLTLEEQIAPSRLWRTATYPTQEKRVFYHKGILAIALISAFVLGLALASAFWTPLPALFVIPGYVSAVGLVLGLYAMNRWWK